MRHPDFLAGRLSTAFVERAFAGGLEPPVARARARRGGGGRAPGPGASSRGGAAGGRPALPLGDGGSAGVRESPGGDLRRSGTSARRG